MRGLRIASVVIGVVALLACVGSVAAASYYAPPDSVYRLSGLVLRGQGGGASLSHRSLACADDATNPLLTTCRAIVDGRELVVTAAHEPRNWGFTACSVAYGGAAAPCRQGSNTVNGPLLAIADGNALGLTDATLAGMRQAHPIENWREADWQRLPFLLAILAALALAVAGLHAPTPHWAGRILVASASAATTFIVAYGVLGVWIWTLGYLD